MLLFVFVMQTGQADDPVAPGFFTRAQAMRGRAQFLEHCATCHADNLAGIGSAPALSGATFQAKWADKSVGTLFDRISSTMPQNAPASLKPDVYADIAAFILRANNFATGPAELLPDSYALKKLPMNGGKP